MNNPPASSSRQGGHGDDMWGEENLQDFGNIFGENPHMYGFSNEYATPVNAFTNNKMYADNQHAYSTTNGFEFHPYTDASPISPNGTYTVSLPHPPNLSPVTPVPSTPISPTHSPHPSDGPFVPDLKKVKLEPGGPTDKWEDFNSGEHTYYELYNAQNSAVTSSLALRTRICAHLEYNPIDDALIMYRQNQFHLEVDFIGGLTNYSTGNGDTYYILKQSQGGLPTLVPTQGLYFHIYAVKHQRGQAFDSDLVEINQSSRHRNGKGTNAPGLLPIESGRGTFAKLQFKSATLNNARSQKVAHTQPSAQQQFFRIVVALVAKVDTGVEYIFTRISPYLVVRGQNPARFKENGVAIPLTPTSAIIAPPPTPIATPTPTITSTTSTPTKKSPRVKAERSSNKRQRIDDEDEDYDDGDVAERATPLAWAKGNYSDSICIRKGRVGINTKAPKEALHVVGNILYTGDLIKPSDQRVKTNIQPVSSASQLENINQLRIYDYELKHGKNIGSTHDVERGLMAQQLKEIIPNATRTLNNVTMADGAVVPELIVVQDRALIYETIGATQELTSMVKQDQERLLSIDKKVDSALKEEASATKHTLNAAGKLLDYILTEKTEHAQRERSGLCCVMVSHTNKGFYGSMFALGPAWTMYLIGFFFPLMWLCGSCFLFSPKKARRSSGMVHLGTLIIWAILFGAAFLARDNVSTLPLKVLFGTQGAIGLIGIIAVGVRWNLKRKQRVHRAQSRSGKQKRKLTAYNKAPEYVLQLTGPAASTTTEASYMSIPMEDLPALDTVVHAVTTNPNPREAIAKAREKNASFAQGEWERNALKLLSVV